LRKAKLSVVKVWQAATLIAMMSKLANSYQSTPRLGPGPHFQQQTIRESNPVTLTFDL